MHRRDVMLGYVLGVVGVVAFGITVPATRAAVQHLPADLVGTGRGLAAALCAAMLLFTLAERWPTADQRRRLWWVVAGVVIGFPWLTAIALQELPAVHGAVVVGVLPLVTAIVAVLRAGERPSPAFWFAGIAGTVGVLVFVLRAGGAGFRFEDSLLIVAVVLCALAYAEGGRLAREMGGWQVISWALVMGAPLLAIPTLMVLLRGPIEAPAEAWATFAFLVLGPQFLAFFAWYRAMALIGIARASQIQLMQIFVSLGIAAWWLGETLEPDILFFALWVLGAVLVGQRARINLQAVRQENRG